MPRTRALASRQEYSKPDAAVTLVKEIYIEASPDLVMEFLTEPEKIARWLGSVRLPSSAALEVEARNQGRASVVRMSIRTASHASWRELRTYRRRVRRPPPQSSSG